MLDFETLNKAQREAVMCTEGPLLVLAGAGSGKTRVLTYRIAHIVQDLGVSPYNVLAVTFTNKAAREMRERLETLVPSGLSGMWIATFHSACLRMLRSHAEEIGYSHDFTIYDADDAKRLVKEIVAEFGYNPKRVNDTAIRSKISTLKNELVGPQGFTPNVGNPFEKALKEVYTEYQHRLSRANAMDFDDLLYNAFVLLRDHDDTRAYYATRFNYILVDEYQDTNKAQYEIVKMLSSVHGNLMVVGDDDQSIYSWRGADIRNILEFERDWPDVVTIKLEENYRSSANILAAANAVIANNEQRKSKELFTSSEAGEKISCFLAADERDEGRWIASKAEQLHREGCSYRDIAVFYRTNAQSRTLEDMFLRAGVPYRIVGGTRFFDRAEIRDVTAYLKLAVNEPDDVSARRIVNTPRRGIGKTTIDRIALTASQRDMSFMAALREEALDPSCRAATKKALVGFVELVDEISSYSGNLSDLVSMIIEKTGLVAALEAQRTGEARGRVENIREFSGVVHDFVMTHEFVPDHDDDADVEIEMADFAPGVVPAGYHVPTMGDFIEWLSLRTDLDTVDEGDDDFVTFMTVHSAKGLEFDNVFVAGLEESIFPHSTSIAEHGVEEERRLAYVAITRARKRLFLSYAQTRRIFNDLQANARSRFVNEIPEELLVAQGVGSLGMVGYGWEKRGDRRGISGSGIGEDMYGGRIYGSGGYSGSTGRASSGAGTAHAPAPADTSFAVGDKVDHKIFGKGEVLAVDDDKLTIRFAKSGKTKKLLVGYAPIVKIS